MVNQLTRLLELDRVHESWKEFFTEERVELMQKIESELGEHFTPKKELILRFTRENLMEKKVIWLGQDPYFQPQVANGRSFQPSNLIDWAAPFKQVSLKNIVRLIHASYHNYTSYDQIKTYKEIMKERERGEFVMLSPREWFDSVEKQGVLFLNTSFTCEENKANSHRELWKQFSMELLQYISVRKPDMIWFLWGKEAISNKQYIQQGKFYESRHPMMCSSKFEDDFLKSKCFVETFGCINWLG